jgi:BON domain-containing protein
VDKRQLIIFAKALTLTAGVTVASVLILTLYTSGSPWFPIAGRNHFPAQMRSVPIARSANELGMALFATAGVNTWNVDDLHAGRKLLQVVDASQRENKVQAFDAILKQRVQQARLADPSLKTSKIVVRSVSEGVVLLSVTAKTESACVRAGEVARAVPGIHRIAGKCEDYRWPEMKRVLNTGEHFVLLSLDPTPPAFRKSNKPLKETFHDYRVLGKTEIRDPDERKRLLRALYRATDDGGVPAQCFNPRHGINARLGDDTVDLVICFECSELKAYGKNGVLVRGMTGTGSPLETFNFAIERAGLPLPRQAH